MSKQLAGTKQEQRNRITLRGLVIVLISLMVGALAGASAGAIAATVGAELLVGLGAGLAAFATTTLTVAEALNRLVQSDD